ncbi:unnamed protein product, partial [Closterium sp. NIES-53]
SSCEVEIYAGAMAAQELRWLTYLLTDLGERPRSSPVLYVDNKAMIALCQEHRLEHRTKHISLRYFLAQDLQQRGQLCLAYMAIRANTADIHQGTLVWLLRCIRAVDRGDETKYLKSTLCVAEECMGHALLVEICFRVDAFARIFVIHRDGHGAVREWSCFVRGVIHVLLVPVGFVCCRGEVSVTTEATCGIPIFFQVGKVCRKGDSFVENDVTCCYCFFGVDVEDLLGVVILFDVQV